MFCFVCLYKSSTEICNEEGEILGWRQQHSECGLTQREVALLAAKLSPKQEASSLLDAVRCLHPGNKMSIQAATMCTYT